MTLLTNNATGGTNGTTVTTGNSGSASGNAFDVVQIGTGCTLIFDNSHPLHNTLAYEFTTPGTVNNSVLQWTTSLTGGSLTQVWFRAYIYITAHTGNLRIIRALSSGTLRGVIQLNATGKVQLMNAAGTVISTSTTTVPLNQWFRLEGFVIGDASVGQLECKIFTTTVDGTSPDETLTTTAAQNTGGTINRVDFGNPSSVASYSHWMVDLGASTTGYIGPVKEIFTGGPSLKKMVLSGSSIEKSSGTGTIKLKKMKVAVTVIVKKPTVTGVIKRKKMKVAISSTEKSSITGVIRRKKQVVSSFTKPIFRITWDSGTRNYLQGISNGVLYPQKTPGVPWNGLISVLEKGDPSSTPLYVDGQIYRVRNVPATYAGTISAYTYPDELEPYIGVNNGITGQVKKTFGLSWRNNEELHLVYNVLLGPSNDSYASVSDNPSATAFSWSFTTLPVNIPVARPSSHLVITVDYAHAGALAALEDILYGNDANAPAMPTAQAVYDLFASYADLIITDNGDGSWTATGPDSAITMLDGTTFQIDWASAHYIDTDDYTIRSF